MVFLSNISSEVGEQNPFRVIYAPADYAVERWLAPRRWEGNAGSGTRTLSGDGEPSGGRPAATAIIVPHDPDFKVFGALKVQIFRNLICNLGNDFATKNEIRNNCTAMDKANKNKYFSSDKILNRAFIYL